MTRVKMDLDNLVSDPDRHGNDRYYVRVKVTGRFRKTRLRQTPGTLEFLDEYTAALRELRAAAGKSKAGRPEIKPPPGASLGWLATRYFASPEFLRLDADSQRTRRGVIEACLREPLTVGSALVMRDCPYSRVDAKHIKMLRDRRMDSPGAANNRKKYMSAMFGWAIEQSDIDVRANPCRDVKPIKVVSDGWHTWTLDDIAQFIKRHPKGTMPYLALCLMLFLGARRQDALRLGPKNRRGDLMCYVPKKTSYVRVEESKKPILAPLAEALELTPHGLETYLVTSHGNAPIRPGAFC